MDHAIHRVENFEIVGPYTLKLQFADGSEQRIDFRPVLEGEVFAPLQDLQVFNTVELDPTFGTLQWPKSRLGRSRGRRLTMHRARSARGRSAAASSQRSSICPGNLGKRPEADTASPASAT
jgi:hypothetical protein